MFGLKLQVAPQQGKKIRPTGYKVAFTFVLGIAILLAANVALLLDQNLKIVFTNLLDGVPSAEIWAQVAALTLSGVIALAFLFGYMWTFADAPTTFAAAWAYAKAHHITFPSKRVPLPVLAAVSTEALFIIIDIVSLLYRRQFFAAKGAEALFWFFLVASLFTPVVGYLMYVLGNKPFDFMLEESTQTLYQNTANDVQRYVQEMPFDKRTRVIGGDVSAFNEHIDTMDVRYEQERQAQITAQQLEEAAKQGKPNPLAAGLLRRNEQATQ